MKEMILQFWNNLSLPKFSSSVWTTVLDVVVVYYLIYRSLLLLKGTQAVRMLLGLLVIGATYFASAYIGLNTVTWILERFFNYFVVVVLILFQDDIRRALSHVGLIGPRLVGRERLTEELLESLRVLVRAVESLATKKIGALIVMERDADTSDYIQKGTELDSQINEELLYSIFLPYSPIHDGAVILQRGRIARAGCFLPLTQNPDISKHLGTRHRAAIGLTEVTDALVIVVSETDGKISLCEGGEIHRGLEPSFLFNELRTLLGTPSRQRSRPSGSKNKKDTKTNKDKASPEAEQSPNSSGK